MGPNFVLDKSFLATTTVSKFRAAVLVANDQAKQADAAAAFCLGIWQDDVAAADANRQTANVRIIGISRAIAGVVSLTRMAKLTTDNVGRVVVATTGQPVLGIAMIASTAVGDHLDILLTPGAVA